MPADVNKLLTLSGVIHIICIVLLAVVFWLVLRVINELDTIYNSLSRLHTRIYAKLPRNGEGDNAR